MVTYIYNLCKLLLFSIDTVSLLLVFLLLLIAFNLLTTALLTKQLIS